MNGYTDELESLLEDIDLGEFDEAARRPRSQVRTPTRRSSYQPRPTTTPASQTQVQAAARNLDSKIETLSNAVKALETRTNGLASEQERASTALRKEVAARGKSTDGIRADVQQTKLLALLLPSLMQDTVPAPTAGGGTVQVVTQSQNQIATLLPLLLLMGGSQGGDASRGPLGDQTTTLLFFLLLTKK
jgi:hypothetical protein